MAILGKKKISDIIIQRNDIPSDSVIKELVERASTYDHSKTHVSMVLGDEYYVTKVSETVWRVACCSTERNCLFFIEKEA